ncbi:MAG TPA: Holliday junction branch migration protein RuvA [Alphaproteobacteria bacterium]|nr:Holliday junction branch migration protein RuvA [Alphaproteobacteria bacterium]
MIAKLSGQVDSIGADHLVIDVGGVGFMVFCSSKFLAIAQLAKKLNLFVETHIREDHIHLYGFGSEQERAVFRLLTSVQGVGPKSALAIQSALSAQEIGQAVHHDQKTMLMRANGIGAKLATRIIMELKDKMLGDLAAAPLSTIQENQESSALLPAKMMEDAVSALVNLGYRRVDVVRVIQQVTQKNISETWTLSALIRKTLAELSV